MSNGQLVPEPLSILIRLILPASKEDQLSELYFEHKRLTQELEDLERSSLRMKSILDDLSVEEVRFRSIITDTNSI